MPHSKRPTVGGKYQCTKCFEWKLPTEFSPEKGPGCAYKSWCKRCVASYAMQRYRENPAKARATNKATHERNKERYLAAARRWKDNNRERNKAQKHFWYVSNSEMEKARATKWRAEHLERAKANARRSLRRRRIENPDLEKEKARRAKSVRRARKAAATGKYTAAEWRALCDQYGNSCIAPSSEHSGPLTPDHVIPLSRGGSNSIDNIQPLCWLCNSRKQARTRDYRPLYQWQKVFSDPGLS